MNQSLKRIGIALAIAVGVAAVPIAQSQAPANPTTAPATAPAPAVFKQAPLPYAFDALEPVIDKQTMELHWGRHHKAQYDALNSIAAQNPDVAKLSIEQLHASMSKFPAGVRNNAGGVWNHDFFWQIMAPADRRGSPSAALLQRIVADFGSVDAMKTQFNAGGATRFGSGWVWLIVKDKKLAVVSTPNQDNPLMDTAEVRGTPILGNDVWEHAYYLKYNNRRGEYLTNWWQVVNWNEVNKRFDEAMK
ncbi:MAG: superoxide dismutase [Betaproteobacteria bacterium]|nr:MAG: superoxide dismutase [Betaproteobacteria bacterium]